MMTKPKLFEFGDSWIWALIVLGFTTLLAWILYYNISKGNHLPLQFYTVGGLVLVTVYTIAIRRYIARARCIESIEKFINQIVGVTEYGVSVAFTDELKSKIFNQFELLKSINSVIDEAAKFWIVWGIQNCKSLNLYSINIKIYDQLKNSNLLVSTEPFSISLLPQKFIGLSFGNFVCVAFDGQKVKTVEQLMILIKHEIGHTCLDALEIDQGHLGSIGHEIFDKSKYGA